MKEATQRSNQVTLVAVFHLQLESELIRVKGELDVQKKQIEELKKQLSAALAEVKELRKINASLNRQLNEMLEDGQLTL